MVKFFSANEASKYLNVGSDEVRHLLRTGKLYARKVGGAKGDYFIHPVDIVRINVLRDLSATKQAPAKPDMLWVEAACKFLVQQVEQSGFKPTLVVGIAFGGLMPAAYVSTSLRCPLGTISVTHYNGRERLPVACVSLADLYVDSKDRLLVVDDVADTGESLLEVKRKLVEREVLEGNIRFATLHKKPGSKFEPDWYVSVVDDWIQYPWEGEV